MIARRLSLASAAILFGAALSGQSLTDHAAALAGASAGVAGATAIRDPLTRLLDAASGAASTGATEAPKPEAKLPRGAQTKPSGVAAVAGPVGGAPSAAPAGSPWRRRADATPALPAGESSFYRYVNPARESNVTSAQLKSVVSGTSNSDVVASLGTPAARITMDDGGHLVEILEYTANGSRSGSIRCTDGHVESVDASER